MSLPSVPPGSTSCLCSSTPDPCMHDNVDLTPQSASIASSGLTSVGA